MLCDISSVRAAVIIAVGTHITPQCRILKVRGNSYPGAVSPSSFMFLSTYIDQMQMVTCGDNHSKSCVNRTLGQKSGAVRVTVSATVLCSVQTRTLLCYCLRWIEKCIQCLAEYLRQQHKWWTKFPKHKASRMKFSALHHLFVMPLMTQTSKKAHSLMIPTWMPWLFQSLHALLTPEAAHEELSEGAKLAVCEKDKCHVLCVL